MTCLLGLIVILPIIYILFFQKAKTTKENQKQNVNIEKMTTNAGIESIKKLKALHVFVQSIEIDEQAKEKILKTIDFETDFIQYRVCKELGEIEYKKIMGEK